MGDRSRALKEQTPCWTRNGADTILKRVEIFCETGPFAHLPDATLEDLRGLIETLDEEQLAYLGVQPLSDDEEEERGRVVQGYGL